MKRFLIVYLLFCTMILISCGKSIPQSSEDTQKPEDTTSFREYFAPNTCPPAVMVNEEVYYFFESVQEINLDNLEFIGEIKNELEITKMPAENLTGNFTPVGTKLYRKNETCIIAFIPEKNSIRLGREWKYIDAFTERFNDINQKHWGRIFGNVIVANKSLPPSQLIMYNGQYYTLTEITEDITLDDFELLGIIDCCFPEGVVPSEDFSGNFVNLETELYSNDEHSIIANDKEKGIIYICYDEETVYSE